MSTPINLSKFAPKDRLAIIHAAARGGNIHELSRPEARVVSKNLSPAGKRLLSRLTRGRPVVLGMVNLNLTAAVQATKAFVVKFAQVDALNKTIRKFPITKIGDLKDPKTKGTPKIAGPAGTPLNKIIDVSSITDASVKRLVARGATVGGSIKWIPIKGGTVEIVTLPRKGANGRVDVSQIKDLNFLIYLPKPYVVATSSGIHREMYPHDSSYVIEGLLRNPTKQNLQRVRDMLDNCAYQVKTLGFVLNGNRGYYLTRSQTNNIPTNILQYYRAAKKAGVQGIDTWLKTVGLPLARKTYAYWTQKSAQVSLPGGRTGFRWIAHGVGPCKEVWESHGTHKAYYFRVLDDLVKFSAMRDAKRPHYAQGFTYKTVVTILDPSKVTHLKAAGKDTKGNWISGSKGMQGRMFVLPGKYAKSGKDEPVIKKNGKFYTFTPAYYSSDRRSRVSGYDSNHMFGPYNAFTKDFVPVAHQVQLYRHARDIATMLKSMGKTAEAKAFSGKAVALKKVVLTDLWDPTKGMLFEYNAATKTRRTNYPFTSSAYSLWAGVFDVNKTVERKMLLQVVNFVQKNLEGPHGLMASAHKTGMHWDGPICWPIHQGMVVRGLRRYAKVLAASSRTVDGKLAKKLAVVADRIALKYLKANYAYWVKSKGTAVPENYRPKKVVIYTGYNTQSNYTWNLAAVWDLYGGLSTAAKASFHSYVALIKRVAPSR